MTTSDAVAITAAGPWSSSSLWPRLGKVGWLARRDPVNFGLGQCFFFFSRKCLPPDSLGGAPATMPLCKNPRAGDKKKGAPVGSVVGSGKAWWWCLFQLAFSGPPHARPKIRRPWSRDGQHGPGSPLHHGRFTPSPISAKGAAHETGWVQPVLAGWLAPEVAMVVGCHQGRPPQLTGRFGSDQPRGSGVRLTG